MDGYLEAILQQRSQVKFFLPMYFTRRWRTIMKIGGRTLITSHVNHFSSSRVIIISSSLPKLKTLAFGFQKKRNSSLLSIFRMNGILVWFGLAFTDSLVLSCFAVWLWSNCIIRGIVITLHRDRIAVIVIIMHKTFQNNVFQVQT